MPSTGSIKGLVLFYCQTHGKMKINKIKPKTGFVQIIWRSFDSVVNFNEK